MPKSDIIVSIKSSCGDGQMSYKQGEDRNQLTLSPMCLDDFIPAQNICRVILAFVNSLDMIALGFKYSETKGNGRPPYNPASMLMLYIYGYLNRIRSSRRLEAETRRNVEVMWLMERLTPDDKTICNFRKDNVKALKKVFRQFSIWCNEQELFGRELAAVDGSKFRANANRKSIHTQKGTEKKLAELEKKISEYMNELEKNDSAESEMPRADSERILEVLKNLGEKKDVLLEWLKKIEENDGKEISEVDPDARLMHTNGDGRPLDACYNVQTVVDSKHSLIVDFDVTTCADDKGALPKMTEYAKEIMGVQEIVATADRGYYDGEDIAICEENKTTCLIPKMKSGRSAPNPAYNQENFMYSKETDSYECPSGAILPYKRSKKRKSCSGKVQKDTEVKLYYNFNACKNCPAKEHCTKEKYGRTVTRSAYQDTLDKHTIRMKDDENKAILKKRKEIVEHPFGTTKAVWGFKQFLCRGQENTTGEASLVFLVYNLRRVFNIFKENSKNFIEAMA